jgi:hypothetical protein
MHGVTHIKIVTINSPCAALHIGYKEKYIEETTNIKFLALEIDMHLNWKSHIELRIPKLSVRSMAHISDITTLNLFCILSFCYNIWNNFFV